MLHSHLARSRFAEARRVARPSISTRRSSKREWLSLGAEADTAEAVRSMLREVKVVVCTEQCALRWAGQKAPRESWQ